MYTHSVLHQSYVWIVILVPEETKKMSFLFIDIQLVERLLDVSGDSNRLFPESK